MTANVARLALPFTDADIASHADVRIYNAASTTLFTVSILLPALVAATLFSTGKWGHYMSHAMSGVNTHGWIKLFASPPVTVSTGEVATSSFERVFYDIDVNTSTTDGVGKAFSANQGDAPGDVSHTHPPDLYVATNVRCNMYSVSYSTPAGQVDFREFHLIRVG